MDEMIWDNNKRTRTTRTVLGSRVTPRGSGHPRSGVPYAALLGCPEGSVILRDCLVDGSADFTAATEETRRDFWVRDE